MDTKIFEKSVSRETMDRLDRLVQLMLKWNPKINLISKPSVSEIWIRHIWDSAQIYELAPYCNNWIDIGSGGGLPALVVAAIAKERNPELHIEMIESDARKSMFLRTAVRELDLNASVDVARIENAAPKQAEVISARALADLDQLLCFAERHMTKNGTALFFKGKTWEEEVKNALISWSFEMNVHKSKTHSAAAILELKDIQRV